MEHNKIYENHFAHQVLLEIHVPSQDCEQRSQA